MISYLTPVLVFGRKKQSMFDRDKAIGICFCENVISTKNILMGRDFALIIIDLSYRPQSGIKLAMLIKKIPRHALTTLAFLTDDEYLKKHVNKTLPDAVILDKTIDRTKYLKLIEDSVKKALKRDVFNENAYDYRLCPDEISYVESIGRESVFHTDDGDIKIPYLSLNTVMEKYNDILIRCHRSYAVNINNIKYIDPTGKTISLHRPKLDLVVGKTYVKKIRKMLDISPCEKYNVKTKNDI